MAELTYLMLLVFAVIVWPVWLYRRMKKVRAMTHARPTDTEDEPQFNNVAYVDEAYAPDGTILARPMAFDEALFAADRRAEELPDIERTLLGKR
jgi:hypothetical protein